MTGKKLVAVLNKKIEVGKAMNALAHMTAGLCARIADKEDLQVINYADQDGGEHWASKHPFIILRADNSNKIRTFRKDLIEAGLPFASFHECMTVGGWDEQVQRSSQKHEEELEYFGIVAFGDAADLDPLTRKFSLWN